MTCARAGGYSLCGGPGGSSQNLNNCDCQVCYKAVKQLLKTGLGTVWEAHHKESFVGLELSARAYPYAPDPEQTRLNQDVDSWCCYVDPDGSITADLGD